MYSGPAHHPQVRGNFEQQGHGSMSTILTLILAGLGMAAYVINNLDSCRRALINLLEGGHAPSAQQEGGRAPSSQPDGGRTPSSQLEGGRTPSSPTQLKELQERVGVLQDAIARIMYVAENERIGSIHWHAGPESSLLDHMLPCDGRTLMCRKYPILFRKVGTVWGGNGIDTFCIPDLRGQFARGWSQPDCPSADPDRNGRKNFCGAKDNDPCTFQQHQVQKHRHKAKADEVDLNHSHIYDNSEPKFYYDSHGMENGRETHDANGKLKYEHYSVWENGGSYRRTTRDASLKHKHGIAVEDEGGSETRPTNVSFVFAIIADLQKP